MYLGMTVILLGSAVLLGSISALIPPILFAVMMQFIYIPLEESNLKKTFGPEYLDYSKKVRRWL
jgi:protein-S-isoprenylcysteine O-methyltransferase Ste14